MADIIGNLTSANIDGTIATTSSVSGTLYPEGPKGDPGNGIDRIELTSSVGLVDTYTIYFTDGSTKTFTVTNGTDGVDGKNLEFNWNGTQLGVRKEGDSQYVYVDLKGEKGDPGDVSTEQLNTAIDNATKTTKTTETAESLVITDSANASMKMKFEGKTEQVQYEGYQLLKKQGLSTPASDTDFWHTVTSGFCEPQEDGWIKMGGDNSEGSSRIWANAFVRKGNIDYEVSTQYTLLVEWRNVNNPTHDLILSQQLQAQDPFDTTESLLITKNELNNSPEYGFKKFLATTKSDLNSVHALRIFTGISANKVASIEIRVTVLKGDYTEQDIVWEPYIGRSNAISRLSK